MAAILVLSADEELAQDLAGAIGHTGLEAILEPSGAGVLELLSENPPALIVLDLSIDKSTGLDLCHTIRDSSGGALLPILMIGTGEEGVRTFGDALAEGGDYYFEKPIDLKTLISKIQTYVGVKPNPHRQALADSPQKQSDLAKSVEQLMDLGRSFTEGLLGVEEDAPRSGLAEQDLFDTEMVDKDGFAEPLTETLGAGGVGSAVESNQASRDLPPKPAVVTKGLRLKKVETRRDFLKEPTPTKESPVITSEQVEQQDSSARLQEWEKEEEEWVQSETERRLRKLEQENKRQEEEERKRQEEEERKRQEEEERKRQRGRSRTQAARGRRAQAQRGRRAQAARGRSRTQAARGRRAQAARGRRAQAARGRSRTQAARGRSRTQAARGRRAQAAGGRRAQAAGGRRAQAAGGRRAQAAGGRRTQAARGRRAQAARGRRTQAQRGRRAQAARGRRAQAQRGRRTQAQEEEERKRKRKKNENGMRKKNENGMRKKNENGMRKKNANGMRKKNENGMRKNPSNKRTRR